MGLGILAGVLKLGLFGMEKFEFHYLDLLGIALLEVGARILRLKWQKTTYHSAGHRGMFKRELNYLTCRALIITVAASARVASP